MFESVQWSQRMSLTEIRATLTLNLFKLQNRALVLRSRDVPYRREGFLSSYQCLRVIHEIFGAVSTEA